MTGTLYTVNYVGTNVSCHGSRFAGSIAGAAGRLGAFDIACAPVVYLGNERRGLYRVDCRRFYTVNWIGDAMEHEMFSLRRFADVLTLIRYAKDHAEQELRARWDDDDRFYDAMGLMMDVEQVQFTLGDSPRR